MFGAPPSVRARRDSGEGGEEDEGGEEEGAEEDEEGEEGEEGEGKDLRFQDQWYSRNMEISLQQRRQRRKWYPAVDNN